MDVYQGLREMVLRLDPGSLGIAPTGTFTVKVTWLSGENCSADSSAVD